jgi:hypothetical protein
VQGVQRIGQVQVGDRVPRRELHRSGQGLQGLLRPVQAQQGVAPGAKGLGTAAIQPQGLVGVAEGGGEVGGLEAAGAQHLEHRRIARIEQGGILQRRPCGAEIAPGHQHQAQQAVDVHMGLGDRPQALQDLLGLRPAPSVESRAGCRHQVLDPPRQPCRFH